MVLITAATAQSHDWEWLTRHLEPGLSLVDQTAQWSTSFAGELGWKIHSKVADTEAVWTAVMRAGDQDPPYMATIWKDGAIVGALTCGYSGHRVGACIGLGMLKVEVNLPGTAVEVEIFGRLYPAVVQADAPLWDARNERIRA